MTRTRSIAYKTFTLTALAAAISACTTVGPDYHVPKEAVVKRDAANATFMGATEQPYTSEPLPADWWRLYQDPVLDKLVTKAFAANADLRVAAANLERAHGVLEEVEEKKRPEVEMSASPVYGRIAGASIGLPEQLPRTGIYDGDIKIGYLLDIWGRVRRAVEAAEADVEAAQAASDLTHVIVAADTARAYAEACSAGYQLKVAQDSVDLQHKFVTLTFERVQRGRGIAIDNSRAQAQLDQLRANLPPLEAHRRTALYRLAVLTGEVPSAFPAEVAQCATPPRVSAAIPVGDGAALLRRRPDVRQAERVLAGATARIGVATAELYPNITLGASFGGVGFMNGFGEANTWKFALGPLISWNLPATSSARSHIAQAKANTSGALAKFDSVVLNALRETESALTVYARELDRNAMLRAARDQSALASKQTARLYQFGRTDFLAALDADRTLASAESMLAASDAQLAADQVQLFLALGGGWENTHAKHGEGKEKGEHGAVAHHTAATHH
ncbi:efflux transporter outer membrane subunit [Massilia sp. Mn16-1_5]|uniref:efflux transporter outer membrane subunit n=1 Tax=Massilia sp. Mn16-1_5 TaxID=2079199 RepID=UPI00109EB31D|nr:TolC family protein [Massilia sp. Mn16-1_5]THC43670.1 RND transporter [Massilia sp. Mn16-1_5]